MDQVRVPLAGLGAVMDKLMAGQWSEIYAQHAVAKE
jgi:hypothetical protein